ncbi:MAG: helix-turn-helix domain-containing protein [Ilumatobacteraceae bacterium]
MSTTGAGATAPKVALAGTRVLRPNYLAEHVEVVVAEPASRDFPPRLSDSLGICLKRGPAHAVTADGKRLDYPRDAISIRPPGCVWSCATEAAFVSIDIAADLLADRRLPTSMTFLPRRALDDLPMAIEAVLGADTALRAEELVVQIATSAIDLVTDDDDPGFRARHHAAATRARDFLVAHLDRQSSLDEIAAAAGSDKFTLLRHFKRAFGTTPHRYLVLSRLDRARTLLIRGAAPADAARLTGFADQSHLTRWFSRVHGTTPAAYTRDASPPPHPVPIAFKTPGSAAWDPRSP